MSRAIRRHHAERLKKRARRILLSQEFRSMYNPGWQEDIEYRMARRWNNMQMCSCQMCGNPRHSGWHEARTLAEKREDDRYHDSYLDYMCSNHIYSHDED